MSYTYRYPHMAVTADAIVFAIGGSGPEILLIKRRNEPFKHRWSLPGGYVDMHETVAEAASRELLEETGVQPVELQFLAYFDDVNRDPRERTISLTFWGTLEQGSTTAVASDDALEAQWFSISKLPDLAFDHGRAVAIAIDAYDRREKIAEC